MSRRVAVDGLPIGYLVRDELGWSFLAGDETQAYVDRPENLLIMPLRELAERHSRVQPFLTAPPGSSFERMGETFTPEVAVINGTVALSASWAVTVGTPMRRRLEDGALVLWRSGLTVRVSLWDAVAGQSPAERMQRLLDEAPAQRYDERRWRRAGVEYLGYRLADPGDPAAVAPLHGFAVDARGGHLRLTARFDDEAELAAAGTILASAGSPTPRQ